MTLRLTTRLDKIAAALGRDEDYPAILIVFEEEEGVWHDGFGAAIDPASVDPRTQVIRFCLRPDGPQ